VAVYISTIYGVEKKPPCGGITRGEYLQVESAVDGRVFPPFLLSSSISFLPYPVR
jgi:hypothetical protein